MFIDSLKIRFSSGNGGRGSAHFLRQLCLPKGGPDGGNGGKGGSVIIRGNKNIKSLYHIRNIKHIKAGDGSNGSANISSGKNGEDAILEVPIGTELIEKDGKFLFSLDTHLQEELLLEGGKGGLGNINFKSSTNQTPKFSQSGIRGSSMDCILNLKIISDFVIIGVPNSGKTSLLRNITNSNAEVSNYDFTTTIPNIGIMNDDDSFSRIKIVDLPPIIEGSNIGKGVGSKFLKHIEYTKNIIVVISATSDDIISDFKMILSELKKINDNLTKKNIILVISKIDKIRNKNKLNIEDNLVKSNIFHIFTSSNDKKGIIKLKKHMISL